MWLATAIPATLGLLGIVAALQVHSDIARSSLLVTAGICILGACLLLVLAMMTPGYIAFEPSGIYWPVVGGSTLVPWDTITEVAVRSARGIRFLVVRTNRPPLRRGLGPRPHRRHAELRDWDMGYPLSWISRSDEFESGVKRRVGEAQPRSSG